MYKRQIFYWENKIIPGEINQIGSSLDLFNTVKSIIGDKKFVVSDDGFDLTPTLLKEEEVLEKLFIIIWEVS